MRILLVGAGGVGTAFARIAARRPFADLVIADYDLSRAQHAAAAADRYAAVQLDARDEQATAALLTEHRCDVLMNATDPRFVMPLFRAALQAGTHYLDMAMSLSHTHPDEPYRKTGVKLGDEQFALADAVGAARASWPWWGSASSRACPTCSRGTRPTRCSARSTRSGSGTAPTWRWPGYDFAPTFSIWTTIEECLNPPVIWEKEPGLVHHAAVQRARDLQLPGRDRPGRVRQRGARGGAARSPAGSRPSG